MEKLKSKAERLLEEIQKTEDGNFTLYLGAAAGVGKTYAMLAKAHQLRESGVDVVLGYLEAHGRLETESLSEGLEIIPTKKITYAGKEFGEVDIEAIIKRDPEVVLIDELAHTNTPSSKYEKRYQDVLEILSEGIDVIATMNIQHIESLNDIVFSLTGVRVAETVPDSILERVDSFRLIDTPPDELIERLKDGKIYPQERIQSALNNFFTEQNLSKLRELSLRKAATKVSDEISEYQVAKRNGRRAQSNTVMVCIDHHKESMDALRYAKRLSDALKADFITLQITSDAPSDAKKTEGVSNNIRLAERLEAKVISKISGDKTEAVLEAIDEYGVTELVMTRPKSRFFGLLFPNLTKSVMSKKPKCIINIVPFEKLQPTVMEQLKLRFTKNNIAQNYIVCTAMLIAVTAFGFLARDMLGVVNITLLYLLTTLFAAVKYGVRYSFLTALLGVLLFDFLFIEPYYSFTTNDLRYTLSFLIFIIVGYTVGRLSDSIKNKNRSIKAEETRFRKLYELSSGLGDFENEEEAGVFALQKLHGIFLSKTILFMPDDSDRLSVFAILSENRIISGKDKLKNYRLAANEQACAEWVYRHSENAGKFTNTLPNSDLTFFPTKAFDKTLAVVAIELSSLDGTTQELIAAFMNTFAVSLWRIGLSKQNQNMKLVEASEKLTSILFNSVYHELKTPLATITGAIGAIKSKEIDISYESKKELFVAIEESAHGMERILKNLLDFARLENGLMHLKKDWCDLGDIINAAYRKAMDGHEKDSVKFDFEIDVPPVFVDFTLLEQAMLNIIDNAVKYSRTQEIKIKAIKRGGNIFIYVSNPSDIESTELERIFDKFYRAGSSSKIKGSGLGLAIAKGIIQAHRGEISASKRHDDFTINIILPIDAKENAIDLRGE